MSTEQVENLIFLAVGAAGTILLVVIAIGVWRIGSKIDKGAKQG